MFCLICSFDAADAYNRTDSELLKSENNQNRDAGSTASTAILVGDRLLVANVGDSRAVICRGGNGKGPTDLVNLWLFISIHGIIKFLCYVDFVSSPAHVWWLFYSTVVYDVCVLHHMKNKSYVHGQKEYVGCNSAKICITMLLSMLM